MDAGTGIAIAGAWIFAGLLGVSPSVTGGGLVIGILCAIGVTAALA